MGLLKSSVSPFKIENYNVEDHSDDTPVSSIMESLVDPFGINFGSVPNQNVLNSNNNIETLPSQLKKKLGNFRVDKLPTGMTYYGEHSSQNTLHGLGLLKKPSKKSTYLGEFANGQYHGIGKLRTKSVRVYQGEFSQGQKDGLGNLKDGEREYLGYFSKNKRHGYGIMKDGTKGIVKKGSFNKGKLDGFGIFRCDHVNYLYKGFFLDGKLEGMGVEITQESTYTGEFQAGERHGIGLNQRTDNIKYLGYWRLGLREGFGTNSTENGDIFEGQYRDDQMHGMGKYNHKNENVLYTGQFLQNQRAGFGRLESRNFIYVGDWDNNKRNGIGYQVTLSDNTSYFGMFGQDMRNGIGVNITKQLEYHGEFKNDKPHGRALLKIKGQENKAAIFQKGKIVNYIDTNSVIDIENVIAEMNFEEHVQTAKHQLDKIEGYISSEKQKNAYKFGQIKKASLDQFDDLELKLVTQLSQLENWFKSIEGKMFLQEEDMRKLMNASGLDFDTIYNKNHDPNSQAPYYGQFRELEEASDSFSRTASNYSSVNQSMIEGLRSSGNFQNQEHAFHKTLESKAGEYSRKNLHEDIFHNFGSESIPLLDFRELNTTGKFKKRAQNGVIGTGTSRSGRRERGGNTNRSGTRSKSKERPIIDQSFMNDSFTPRNRQTLNLQTYSHPSNPLNTLLPSQKFQVSNVSQLPFEANNLSKIDILPIDDLTHEDLTEAAITLDYEKQELINFRSKLSKEKARVQNQSRYVDRALKTHKMDAIQANHFENQDIESEISKLKQTLKKLEAESTDIQRKQQMLNSETSITDADMERAQKVKIDTDRQRIAYENSIKKARYKKKKVKHAEKQLKRKRLVQDDKIIEIHRLIQEEKQFSTEIQLQNKRLVERQTEFEERHPEYLLTYEKQGMLSRNLKLAKQSLESATKRLLQVKSKNDQFNIELQETDIKNKVGQEKLDFNKQEKLDIVSRLEQRMVQEEVNLKNTRQMNDRLKSSIQELKQGIFEKQASMGGLRARVKEFENDTEALDRDVKELGILSLRQKGELKLLEDQLTSKCDQLNLAHFEVSSAQAKNQDLDSQIMREQKKLENLTNTPDVEMEYTTNIERTKTLLQEVKSNLTALDPQRKALESQRETFFKKRNELSSMKEKFRTNNTTVKDLKLELESLKHRFWNELEAVNKDRAIFKTESEIQSEKEVGTEGELMTKDLEIAQVREKIKKQKKVKSELVEQETTLDNEIKEYKKVHKALDEKVEANRQLKREIVRISKEKEELSEEKQLKQGKLNDCELDINDKEFQLKKATNRLQNNAKVRAVEEKERAFEKELRGQEDRRFDEKMNEKLKDMENDVKKQVELFETQNKLVSVELETATGDLESLDSELQLLETNFTETEASESTQLQEIDSFRQNKSEEKGHYEKEWILSKELHSAQDQKCKELQDQSEVEIRDLEREKAKIAQLDEILTQIKKEEASKKEEREQKQAQFELERQKYTAEKDQEIALLQQEVDLSRDKIQADRQTNQLENENLKSGVEVEKNELDSLMGERDKLCEEADEKVREIRREREIEEELQRRREEDERIMAEEIAKQRLEMERENAVRREELLKREEEEKERLQREEEERLQREEEERLQKEEEERLQKEEAEKLQKLQEKKRLEKEEKDKNERHSDNHSQTEENTNNQTETAEHTEHHTPSHTSQNHDEPSIEHSEPSQHSESINESEHESAEEEEEEPNYFKNHEPPEHLLTGKISSCCKLSTNTKCSKIIVGGNDGCFYLSGKDSSIKLKSKFKSIIPQMVKITPNGFAVIHNLKENKLQCFKLPKLKTSLKEFKAYPGIIGESDPLVNSRFQGDDKYVVWMRGKQHLAILNLKKTQVIDIPDFWMKDGKKVLSRMAIADKTVTRLLGIGLDMQERQVIIYWKKKNQAGAVGKGSKGGEQNPFVGYVPKIIEPKNYKSDSISSISFQRFSTFFNLLISPVL